MLIPHICPEWLIRIISEDNIPDAQFPRKSLPLFDPQ